jgi:hypothetical protein
MHNTHTHTRGDFECPAMLTCSIAERRWHSVQGHILFSRLLRSGRCRVDGPHTQNITICIYCTHLIIPDKVLLDT